MKWIRFVNIWKVYQASLHQSYLTKHSESDTITDFAVEVNTPAIYDSLLCVIFHCM
jgi:hypothetical protein